MAPKKATAAVFLVRAKADGVWNRSDKGYGDSSQGEFRVSVNTDVAGITIHMGPDFLEDWNPATLRSYSMRYLRGGSHLRISFELEKPLGCKGELELDAFGGFVGKLEGLPGQGKVTGAAIVEEKQDHVHELPRPTKELAEKLQKVPSAVRWEVPESVSSGKVILIGLGGSSKTGKSTLAQALIESLRKCGREAAIVEQSRYERSAGTYNCSAGVNESMYDSPASVNWTELAKSISSAAGRVASNVTGEAPGIVVVEGSLVFWMKQINDAFAKRIYLRASRQEVLRRRQASQALAEPFVEHVFWPMHLQYGQPQGCWEEICIEDETEGYPLPDSILSEALGILDIAQGSTHIEKDAADVDSSTLPEATVQDAVDEQP